MDERLKKLAQDICENLNPFFKKTYNFEENEEFIVIKSKDDLEFYIKLKIDNNLLKVNFKSEKVHPEEILKKFRHIIDKNNFKSEITLD